MLKTHPNRMFMLSGRRTCNLMLEATEMGLWPAERQTARIEKIARGKHTISQTLSIVVYG